MGTRSYAARTEHPIGRGSPEYTGASDCSDKFPPRFSEKIRSPGDGYGILIRLEDASEALKAGNAPAVVQHAVGYAVTHASMAVVHAYESVHGTGIKQTQEHAVQVAALLVGAHGKGDTNSPATSTLAYAMKQSGLKIPK